MLSGIKIFDIKKNIDERGFFCEIFRNDWSALFDEDDIVQVNLSVSYPGMIRAWHRHKRGQVDYFLVLQGALKICAYDGNELNEIIVSSEKLQLVRIPGYYWHGFKNISDTKTFAVYFVNKLYDYAAPDEERRPWNDPTIIDKTGAPFDWNRPPHK
jgi:dTDP-4-dehydrorhamnose 3,5-epimerase